ncbi:LacI family DNA-binding transcriptional regulator [Bacillus marinisedimentorum]|uniref:LacI family DNA-binding transcriptional regulator n=1 Tax=Bacillus marinisedimentorum TaxID=1821260 RepID=UPI0007DE563F|nr:LacI family DNA-binding transcriptional regulator [Bacillus marinisedimentorum]
MITIKEIAKLANVSRTTVSRALNNSGYVSEDARKRIEKVIEETGYVPSEHAKSLRTKKTKVIGVILPKISTETASRVVNGIDEELAGAGYQILLANTNLDRSKEIEYLKLLKSRQVDGIILLATNVSDTVTAAIHDLDLPFVAIGQDIPEASSVLYDDYHAARDITRLFIEKGHEKIAFIGVDESDRAVGYLRKKAFLDTLDANGITVRESWVKNGRFTIESGYDAMKAIIETNEEKPTAVFAVTDRLAVGAMEYLKKNGYHVPNDVAIAGIGASELSKYVTPSLTTVAYQNEEAGRTAGRLMLKKVLNSENSAEKVVLSYRLIKQDSL